MASRTAVVNWSCSRHRKAVYSYGQMPRVHVSASSKMASWNCFRVSQSLPFASRTQSSAMDCSASTSL